MAKDSKEQPKPNGRPLKFESAKEIQLLADEYFKKCDIEEEPYTITGLALALDTDRQTLVNYEKREEFFDTIKRIKLKVENYAEKLLLSGKGNATGVIFSMKNNYGWKDKTEVENTVSITKDLDEFYNEA